MNYRGTKWFALLLAVIMMISVLPFSALAEEGSDIITDETQYEGSVLESVTLNQEKGFTINAIFLDEERKEVADLEQADPNHSFTLNLTVAGIEDNQPEKITMVYPLANVQIEDGENENVTWTYDAEQGQLVFNWKEGKKAASFSASMDVVPAYPAKNEVSGSYMLISKSKQRGMITDEVYDKGDGRARLLGVNATVSNGIVKPDGWRNTYWTFTHVTGDWYTISSNGKYMEIKADAGGNGLFLTSNPETAQKIKLEEVQAGKLYRFYVNGLRITTQGDKPTNGYASYTGAGDNETFELFTASQVSTEPTNDLSGSWAILNTNASNFLTTTANGSKLQAASYEMLGDKYCTEGTPVYWTFEHITRDWYYISANGQYLNISNAGIKVTGTKQPIYAKLDNGSVILSESEKKDAYTLRAENATTFSQVKLAVNNNTKMKLASAGDFYSGSILVFSANGGSEEAPAGEQAENGEKVVLPDYTGTKNGTRFIGWAKVSNIYNYIPGTTHSAHEIYLPGTEYTPGSGKQILYAAFNEQGTNAQFGFRKDGTIPDEPGNYEVTDYTGHFKVNNAVKDGKWVVDINANKTIEGNHVANDVTANLNVIPSDEQIKKAMPSYDPETQYVHWYVLKWAGQWKIDGVIRNRVNKSIAYHTNVGSRENNTDVTNMPDGFDKPQNSIVTVGAAKDGTIRTPERSGYTFTGWNTEADGSGTAYTSNSSILLNDNVDLYAQWTKEDVLSIRIDSDWPDGQKGYKGARITLTATLYGFEDKTYTLQWQYSEDGGESWTDIEGANKITYTYTLDENTTRYKWRILAKDVK